MKLAKRLSAIVGAVALAGAFAALFAPKAVHAVTATLVQVVNTPSAPAVTLDVSKAASQIREVFCSATFPGQIASNCGYLTETNPPHGLPFVVPAGQKFVITAIDVTPVNPKQGIITVGLLYKNSGGLTDIGEYKVTNTNTSQILFPTSGIVFVSGTTVDFQVSNDSAGGALVIFHGYLTSN